MTIDDAIKQERKQVEKYRCEYECECDYYGKFIDDYADELDCIKNMHEHEQIAEWLEELKVYQQHEIICNKGYNSGYNRAIDDFIHEIDKYCGLYSGGNKIITREDVLKISEQLKAGGKNE